MKNKRCQLIQESKNVKLMLDILKNNNKKIGSKII
jgi:hypothetical protein